MNPFPCSFVAAFPCVLSALVAAVSLPTLVSGQVLAPRGVDLRKTGLITNGAAHTSPTSVTSTGTSWEFSPSLQGRLLPSANLTGLNTSGGYLNYEDLLALKVTKLRVMAGAAGAVPTGVGTIIDSAGIDTTSLITDSLFVTDAVTGALNQIRFSNGTLGLPGGNFVMGADTGNSATGGNAVALGGNSNLATGDKAMVLGGSNISGQQNVASGLGSLILGARNARVESATSVVMGGQGNQILGSSSSQSFIMGGYGNRMDSGSSGNNAIIVANASSFTGSGAMFSAIVGGFQNSINGGNLGQVIAGGYQCSIGNAEYSAIVGGSGNQIQSGDGTHGWAFHGAAIVGGRYNTTGPKAELAVIMGGTNNSVTGLAAGVMASASGVASGTTSAVLASSNSEATADRALATGLGTKATGQNQVAVGRWNVPATDKALIIGNGSSDIARSNAFTVDFNGNVEAGSLKLTAPQGNISMGAFTDQ